MISEKTVKLILAIMFILLMAYSSFIGRKKK